MDPVIRIKTLHLRKVELGYTDMMEPLSREFLLDRGYCCGFGCMNCPYHEADAGVARNSKQIQSGPKLKSSGSPNHVK